MWRSRVWVLGVLVAFWLLVSVSAAFAAGGFITIGQDDGGVTFARFVSGYNSAYSGGGYVYSRWADETLEVKFSGERIVWYGPKQPNYGTAEVYLDGVFQRTVDCFAAEVAKTTRAAIWTSDLMTEGWHTLRIRATGDKNPLSSGTIVVVDDFSVEGLSPRSYAQRSDEAAGMFGGPWIYGANSAYVAKGYRYSRYVNAGFTKSFTGTKISWIGPKTGSYGRAKVFIDGVQQGTVVSQAGPTAWRAKIWESPTLPYGVHTLAIRPTGTKDATSKSTNIVIDAIDVSGGPE